MTTTISKSLRLRAKQRAETDAKKKAGVAIKFISRSINSELADNAVSAVTNNIIELVGEVHYDKKIVPLNDQQTTILYTATLKARIDTDGIYDWFKRNSNEKVTIIQQNDNLQDAIQKNDKLAESLTEQYNRATSQAERDSIIKQMKDADREFLANQKLEEGNKFYYAKDYNEAIKLYDESLQIKPNQDKVFFYRGNAYALNGNRSQAIEDYTKSIQINPNFADAYFVRGGWYYITFNPQHAIDDMSKYIELCPNDTAGYTSRAFFYTAGLRDYARAIQDYTKAINLKPNDYGLYKFRGECYQALGDEAKAQADFAKAKELGWKGCGTKKLLAILTRSFFYAVIAPAV